MRHYIFLLLSFFLSATCIQAKIIETAYIAEVIDLIDTEAWFLVDLDNTLFEAKQALGHVHHFYDEMQQKQQKGMTREEAIRETYLYWGKLQEACPVKPLENNFISSLLALQNSNVAIMGFTHRHPSIASATAAQAASLGIDFTQTAPSKEVFTLPFTNPALYTNGILFCSDFNSKSDVFLKFLSKIKKSPRKIVFIDDRKKNVEEVVENLSKNGMECLGIYYTAIERVPPVYSRELAQFQSKFVNTLLSNEAAALLLENGWK